MVANQYLPVVVEVNVLLSLIAEHTSSHPPPSWSLLIPTPPLVSARWVIPPLVLLLPIASSSVCGCGIFVLMLSLLLFLLLLLPRYLSVWWKTPQYHWKMSTENSNHSAQEREVLLTQTRTGCPNSRINTAPLRTVFSWELIRHILYPQV